MKSDTQDCPARFILQAFAEGLLTDSQAGELLDHIEKCSMCLDEVRTYQDESDFVPRLRAALRRPDLFQGEELANFEITVLNALGLRPLSQYSGQLPPRQIGSYTLLNCLIGRPNAYRALSDRREVQLDIVLESEVPSETVNSLESLIGHDDPFLVPVLAVHRIDGFLVLERPLITGIPADRVIDLHGPFAVSVSSDIAVRACSTVGSLSPESRKLLQGRPSEVILTARGPQLHLTAESSTIQSANDTGARLIGLLAGLLGASGLEDAPLSWRLRWKLQRAARGAEPWSRIADILSPNASPSETQSKLSQLFATTANAV